LRRWGTKLFLALSVLVFALDLFLRGALLEWGAKSPAIWAGEYHRLFSATFLHADLRHLLFNMYALFVFGSVVENLVGSVRFCIVFLLGGAAGYVASLLVQPQSLAVGASAAIFGLIGYTVHFRLRRLPKRYMRIDTELLQILGLNLLIGLLVPRIDQIAHVGGFLGGALAGSLVGLPSPEGQRSPTSIERAMGLLPFALMAALVLSPEWVLTTTRAISPDVGAYVDRRYGPYIQPLRADAQILMWIYSDGREGGWQPVDKVLQIDTRRPAQLALFWRWEKGRGATTAGFPYVVHWERLDPSGQVTAYHMETGTAYAPDPDPTLIYARSSMPVAIGRWQVRLVVDGREVWRQRCDVVEEGRRAEG
jgi:membrane associated rhomboid family serine protease